MSLFRKLVILFGLVIIVVLSATLSLVYSESHRSIVEMSTQKAISIIQTIDSSLESNIPDYQFESVLLHLKEINPDILSFDIYKLNGSLYDIASTNPKKIGSQASKSSIIALGQNQITTSLHGTTIELTAPIHGYNGIYSADVEFSVASDLRYTHVLLVQVLWIGILAILLAVFAAWLFTRVFVSKPVLAVVSAVNDVARGNLHVNLTRSARRRDEIGGLARSFQRMTDSLQQLMARMAETADELKQDFQELVRNGDFTASGALHVSDVVQHVAGSVDEQATHLTALREKMLSMNNANSFGTTGDYLTAELADDIEDCIQSVQLALDKTQEMKVNLQSVTATANGQLGAIQEVNHTAARLSQMANELRELIISFEV